METLLLYRTFGSTQFTASTEASRSAISCGNALLVALRRRRSTNAFHGQGRDIKGEALG